MRATPGNGQDTGQMFRVAADNVGYRDQRFFGEFDRPGRFKVTGLWDQIPQFYSIDTQTPYTSGGPGCAGPATTALSSRSRTDRRT